jgi:hypothetical protein
MRGRGSHLLVALLGTVAVLELSKLEEARLP